MPRVGSPCQASDRVNGPRFSGCASLLDRFAAVYVECSFVPLYAGQPLADEVLAHLREWGFRLSGVYNLMYDREGRSGQAE